LQFWGERPFSFPPLSELSLTCVRKRQRIVGQSMPDGLPVPLGGIASRTFLPLDLTFQDRDAAHAFLELSRSYSETRILGGAGRGATCAQLLVAAWPRPCESIAIHH